MADSIAIVASLEGQAWAKSPDGTLRPLKVGDSVTADEVVVTATGARIELDFGDGKPVAIAGGQEVLMGNDLWVDLAADKQDAAVDDASVQEALRVLNEGGDLTETLEETAAGLDGGGASEGHGFVALTRVVENTDPSAFNFGANNGDAGTTPNSLASSNQINHAPQAEAQSFIGDEDTVINGRVIATDIENDTLSYSLVNPPAHGTVTLDPVTGNFVYTPNSNYNGPDSFVVTITDDHGNSTTTTIGLTVAPVNDAPTTTNINLTTDEDTPVNGQVVAQDVEGDTLAYTVSGQPANGTVTLDPVTGAFVYTPNANYNGGDSFVVTISDGNGGTTTSTITIGVNPVNDAPVSSNQNLVTDEDVAINGQVVASDVDGDTLAYTVSGQPTNGTVTLDPVTGAFVYTPNANYNGSDSFVVTISDGNGGTTTSLINIGINPVNDAPVSGNQNLTTPEDTPVSGQVNATDVDGDTLSFVVSGNPANGTVTLNPATGGFVYTPNANYNGSDSFVVTISDGKGGTTTSLINIGVTPVNDAPVSSNLNLTTPEDTPVNGQINATDVDGDTLSFAVSGNPANGTVTLNPATGGFVYTPNANYNGSDSFVVTISDGKGGTTTSVVSIGVTPVNDAPIASNLNLTTNEDTPVNGSISASDPDGDTLSFSITGAPANGTVVLNAATGTFTYTPSIGYNGSDSFVVTVSDGNGGTVTSTVTIGVNAVNHAPTAADDSASTNENTAVTVAVRSNDTDPDGDSLTVTGVTQGANGSVAIDGATGNPIYTPNAGFTGTDTFTYTISDGHGGTDTATVTVTVNAVVPINHAPVAVADTFTVAEGGTLTGAGANVLTNDTDADGDSLTAILVTGPANGTLTLNANGTFTYIHNGSETTTDSFTYKVNDGTVDGNTVTVTINVTPVNDAPIANDDTTSVNEDDSVIVAVRANDTDAEGDALTVHSVTQGTNGSVTIDTVTGNPIYKPNAGFSGTDSFTYTVRDPSGAVSNTATVTVTVNPVNHAPVAVADTFTVAEGGTLTGAGANVLTNDTDADGDSLTAILVTGPANGTLTLNANGTFTYIHNGSETTTDSFTYKVNDGTVDGNTVKVTINVTPVNDAPIANDDTASVNEDDSVIVAVRANDTDAEGDALTVHSVTQGTNGSVTIDTVTGNPIYKPNAGFSGTDSFTYTVRDPSGAVSNTATVTVTVNPVNHAPVAVADSASVNQDAVLTLAPAQLLANDTDIDGDTLNVASVQDATHGTVSIVGGNVVFTPTAGYHGPASFTYTINDGHGGTATATVNVTVNRINHSPVAVDDPVGIAYSVKLGDASASDLWTTTDSKGQAITINAYKANGTSTDLYVGTVDGNANVLGVGTGSNANANNTPRTNASNTPESDVPNQIEYDVKTGKSEALELKLNGNVNSATFAVSRLYPGENGGEVGMWQAFYKGTLVTSKTFLLHGVSSVGSFTIDTGNLVFDSIKFYALHTVDGTGDGGDYFLTSFSANGPASANTHYTVAEGATLNINSASSYKLLSNDTDADGDTLSVSQINGVSISDGQTVTLASGASLVIHSNGSFDYSTGTVFNSLSSGQVTTDSFTYTISDGHGGTATATATMTIIGKDLTGTAGNDILVGGNYSEQIVGGPGNDTMTGGAGADTFKWSLNDQGSKGAPAIDTITDFTTGVGGDKLDLRDLLQNESSSNLTNYLHFSIEGADTIVSVSSTGSFNGSNYKAMTDQSIVLNHVNLTGTDSAIINLLKTNGNLITD